MRPLRAEVTKALAAWGVMVPRLWETVVPLEDTLLTIASARRSPQRPLWSNISLCLTTCGRALGLSLVLGPSRDGAGHKILGANNTILMLQARISAG
eukprot:4340678-Amphidinium_carterae.2